MKNLNDKVVVITGAAGGMGREMAIQAAQQGAHLALSDWNEEALAETAELCRQAGVTQLRTDRIDVSDREAMHTWAEAVAAEFGRVNMMINNAGVTVTGDFETMTYEDFDWIVGINFYGVVHGTKEFLPHLIASGDGALVNISSLFGLISMPGQSAYNATKYAVRGFSEALREEMLINKHNVSVTVVHPGGIRTGIARNGRKNAELDGPTIDRLFDKRLARMDADKAARIILNGALKKRARVLVGIDAHLIHHLAKNAGSTYQDVVAKIYPAVTK
jgi:short-subunit dehydrogenase